MQEILLSRSPASGVGSRIIRRATPWFVLAGLSLFVSSLPGEDALSLSITRAGTDAVVTWTDSGAALESASSVTGVWTQVTGAASPYVVAVTNFASYFRLRQITLPFDFRYLPPSFTTSIGDPAGCGCTSPETPNSLGAGGNPQENGLGNVLLHTGELTQHAVDLEIPGRGFNWRFDRVYRSGMDYDGPLGHGWDFSHNRRLVVETNGNVLCMNGLGRADRYALNTNGGFDSPSGFYTRLSKNPDGTFEERERHGSTHFYSAATNLLRIARLSRLSDRNGNQMTFQYNTNGQLTSVTDTLNRSISYAYDANGRLTNVVDFTGRTLRYAYDANGDLVSVTSPAVIGTPNGNDFPAGKTTSYRYAGGFGDPRFNHNLLSVTAPSEAASSGPPWLVAQYDTATLSPNADRLVTLRVGGTNASGLSAGGTIYYGYASLGPAASNDYASAVFRNLVTNRNGNVSDFRFNQLGNLLRTVRLTRGLRPGEPAGFTNTFAYNRDGEMIARTNAELDSVQYTFDVSNPDRLQQGNLLQTVQLPGPRGGGPPQIITSLTYETNFNFVRTSTDGRTNTTTSAYDARGNPTNVLHRIPSIVEDFEYNSFGQMTAYILPDNGSGHRRRDGMTYYTTGPQAGYLQTRLLDSGGLNLTTSYEYDAVGNAVRVIDPRGNDTLYTVNALSQVVRHLSRAVTTATNGLVRYQIDTFYDLNENVVRVDVQNRDETGTVDPTNPAFTTARVYDILNDLVRTAREVDTSHDLVTTNAYDANQNRVLAASGQAVNGNQANDVLQSLYDERDLLFREIRAPGSSDHSTTQSDYDANGNLVRTSQGTEDAGGRVTTFTCDGYDRRTTTTDPMGNVSTSHFDANENVTSTQTDGELIDVPGSTGNIRLSETTYEYDAEDRRTIQNVAHFDTQTQTPIGDGFSTAQWTYADNSQVTSRTDDNPGHVTTTIYDTANRRRTVTDAKGNTTTYSYDANGNVLETAETDKSDLGNPSQTFTNRFVYDELDRVTQRTDNLANTQLFAYDSRGNRLLYNDARGNKTHYAFDGLSRLLRTSRDMDGNGIFTDSADIVTSRTWDDDSRLTSQTDDNTNTTTYVYDPLGRRIGTIYADCTTNSTSYDVHDNAVATTDANATQVASAYDALNRLTNKTVLVFGNGVATPPLGTSFEYYAYDGRSRMVRAEDNDSLVTRRYDSLSKVLQETQQLANPPGPARTVTAQYDGEGNQTRLDYPGGRSIVRSYDLLDRPSFINDDPPAGPPIAIYAYLGPYRVEQRDYPKLFPAQTTRFTPSYDGIRRMNATQHHRDPFGASVAVDDRFYDWDPNSNKTGMHRPVPAPPEDRFYNYDAADRLIQSQVIAGGPPSIITYSLDGVGNRANVSGGAEPGPYTMDPTLCEPADFRMNQYTTTPPTNSAPPPALLSEQFAYADGNLAGNGTWTAHSAPGLVPVQVNTGKARLAQGAGSREDVNALLGATMGAGQKFYAAFDLANTGGNGAAYFAHFKDAGTANFAARVFIASNGLGDYTVGLSGSSAAVGATWPAGLTFGTTYRIVTSYEFNTGKVELWVDPASQVSQSILATGSANFAMSAYALRQVTPSVGASTQTIDNLCASDSFTNALNCLAPPAGTPRQYDANGNLISTGVPQNFIYDYRNRLVQFGGGGQIATYRYDCLGRRIEKNVNGTITHFYYDGPEEMEEQNAANATLATYVYSKGAHTRLQMVRGGQKYHYHEDDLGSVMKVTDVSGNIVEQYKYDDFGTPSFFDHLGNPIAQSAIGNPWNFTGQRFDPETGLYYTPDRYLDPRRGRYAQRVAGGAWANPMDLGNALTYAANDPVSMKTVARAVRMSGGPYSSPLVNPASLRARPASCAGMSCQEPGWTRAPVGGSPRAAFLVSTGPDWAKEGEEVRENASPDLIRVTNDKITQGKVPAAIACGDAYFITSYSWKEVKDCEGYGEFNNNELCDSAEKAAYKVIEQFKCPEACDEKVIERVYRAHVCGKWSAYGPNQAGCIYQFKVKCIGAK